MFRRLLPALLLASLCSLPITAQIAADLRGKVLDPSGSAISNATINLTQRATNTHFSTLSSRSGDYSFTNLKPGVYQLDLDAPGFAHLTRSGIRAIVGQTINVDLDLT